MRNNPMKTEVIGLLITRSLKTPSSNADIKVNRRKYKKKNRNDA